MRVFLFKSSILSRQKLNSYALAYQNRSRESGVKVGQQFKVTRTPYIASDFLTEKYVCKGLGRADVMYEVRVTLNC